MHDQSRGGVGVGRLRLLLVLSIFVAAAVVAAPALAATPTTLTVTAQKASVNWGATGILNGVLQTTANPPLPVDQQQVLVQYAIQSAGPWTTTVDSPITNNAAPYSSGAYTYSWTASRNLYWRMTYLGTTEWSATVGNYVFVQVKAVVGKPSCPSSVKHGKKFTVSGSLKPLFPAGPNAKVKAQRYSGGKWRAYRSYTAATANSGSFSKYSVRLSISKKGKYRFYASSVSTSTLAAGKSVYSRSLRIK